MAWAVALVLVDWAEAREPNATNMKESTAQA
jgi:hypothetical protein